MRRDQPPNAHARSRSISVSIPNGALAGHIIGYAGRAGTHAGWPDRKQRTALAGRRGARGLGADLRRPAPGQGRAIQHLLRPDAGRRPASRSPSRRSPATTSSRRSTRTSSGSASRSLAKGCKRGAIVIIDPNNGDILALASWPTINPNAFIPTISVGGISRRCRTTRIFRCSRAPFARRIRPARRSRCFVGLAALQSGKIRTGRRISAARPRWRSAASTFRNWKKTDAGSLNFADALTQSCNTWFYQVGHQDSAASVMSD